MTSKGIISFSIVGTDGKPSSLFDKDCASMNSVKTAIQQHSSLQSHIVEKVEYLDPNPKIGWVSDMDNPTYTPRLVEGIVTVQVTISDSTTSYTKPFQLAFDELTVEEQKQNKNKFTEFLNSYTLDIRKMKSLFDLALKLQAQQDLPDVQHPKPYISVRPEIMLDPNPIVCEVSCGKGTAEPDLRLIRGDLGKPDARSEAVTKIEKLFSEQQDKLASDIILLLGPSGCGKTKTGFDVLRSRFGMFIDMSPNNQPDVAHMQSQIDDAVSRKTDMLASCKSSVHILVLARCMGLLLYIYKTNKKITPEEWLYMQQNGALEVFTHYAMLIPILSSVSPKLLLDTMLSTLKTMLGMRLVMFVDEANYMLKRHPVFDRVLLPNLVAIVEENPQETNEELRDSDESAMDLDVEPETLHESVAIPGQESTENADPEELNQADAANIDATDKRTEFSVIMEEFGNMTVDLVNSGTAIRLKDKQLYISVIGKLGGGRVRELVTISEEFRRLGGSNLQKFLSRIINTSAFTDQHWTCIKNKFTGRFRMVLYFLFKVITTTTPITELLSQCIDELVTGKGLPNNKMHISLIRAIKLYDREIGRPLSRKYYSMLVVHYQAYSGYCLRDKEDVDFQSAGIVFLSPQEQYWHICEPLVVDTIIHFLKQNDICPLATYFDERLSDASVSNSAKGDFLDLAVGLSLCSKRGMLLSDFLHDVTPDINFPESVASVKFGAKKLKGTSHRENLKRVISVNEEPTLEKLLKKPRGDFILIPGTKNDSRADGQLISRKLRLLYANKFAGIGQQNITQARWQANEASTMSDEALSWDKAGINPLYIRLHVILPAVQKELGTGKVRQVLGCHVSRGVDCDIITVNIDKSNLHNLMPSKLALVWREHC